MKHLEHEQVTATCNLIFKDVILVFLLVHLLLPMQILTIMDSMYPTSLAKGCCVIQEGDDGSTVYVLEGKPFYRVQMPLYAVK